MELAEILKLAGRHKSRKRVGRGTGSGVGKTCGRGHKGSLSRAGADRSGTREGGLPLFRRIPKRGFTNSAFRKDFAIVNVGDLEKRFDAGAHVTPEAMLQVGLIRNLRAPVKILGDGDLSKKFKVEAAKFSRGAEEKIRQAGGETVTT